MRKIIDAKTHLWLDIGTTGAFFLMGGLFWKDSKRASISALINGGMVLGLTLMTDYKGDGSKPVSFPTHGIMDGVQAATAATLPFMLGFNDEPEAKYFWMQASNEGGVIAMTDWNSRIGRGRRRKAA